MVSQENSKVQQQSPSPRWSNPYRNTGVGLAKKQLCRKQLEAFGDGKLHRSQQSTLAAVQVNLLLGCFSSGIAGEVNYSHGTGGASLEILHSFQGHAAQERHGQTGPGSEPSNCLAAGGHDMYRKGAGVTRVEVKWSANYLPLPKVELERREPIPSQRHREK